MKQLLFKDPNLEPIYVKVLKKERLSKKDGLCIYNTHDIIGLGKIAWHVRHDRYGKKAFYIYNQHLNYTNICKNRCLFCAYAKDRNQSGAYVLSLSQIEKQLMQRINEPVNELHIVGGLNESLDFNYFIQLLKTVKRIRPKVTVKAFTCVEIDYLSKLSGLTLENTVDKLKKAGLDMMPGGGAEILNSRIHDALFPKKIDHYRWIEIVKKVHRAGIKTNATMLYGHIESIEERVEHLMTLRAVQDETHGFSAFIPLAFHPQNTELNHIPSSTAIDDLKNVAASRLILDNFDHIKAYWVMIGESLAQVALNFGADDLDGTIMEERIVHTAGATSAKGLTRQDLVKMIMVAGFEPVERDSFYRPISF